MIEKYLTNLSCMQKTAFIALVSAFIYGYQEGKNDGDQKFKQS